MLKLVLDTNTMVSGLIWRGNEFQLLEKVESGEAIMFVSNEIIRELNIVMQRPKIQKYLMESGSSAEQLIEKIVRISESIVPDIEEEICRDKKDNKFIECALAANSDYIVSGDEDLLSMKEFRNIKIVKTSQILKLI
ncbi:MAG: putative toxin-antitoxin system toxin component, PIN family [Nanoarchaeota archaeon]|nr:putative toxin-antitoxin system toxin component, PIN family [Nanoarchaeota archaeon]